MQQKFQIFKLRKIAVAFGNMLHADHVDHPITVDIGHLGEKDTANPIILLPFATCLELNKASKQIPITIQYFLTILVPNQILRHPSITPIQYQFHTARTHVFQQ